jgi:hypothetical protein
MPDVDDYYFYALWSEEDNQYAGLCDEFPSLCWLEPFIEDALKGIRRCVSEMLAESAKPAHSHRRESLPL